MGTKPQAWETNPRPTLAKSEHNNGLDWTYLCSKRSPEGFLSFWREVLNSPCQRHPSTSRAETKAQLLNQELERLPELMKLYSTVAEADCGG